MMAVTSRLENVPPPIRGDEWLVTIRKYLAALLGLNLLWESAHLPLYTVWQQGSTLDLVWAVIHCSAGDLLIGIATLTLALVLVGNAGWPAEGSSFRGVAAVAIASGIAYTIFSEWLNTSIRGAWSYAAAMPVLPPLGTGVSPLAQWMVVPTLSFLFARRGSRRPPRPSP